MVSTINIIYGIKESTMGIYSIVRKILVFDGCV